MPSLLKNALKFTLFLGIGLGIMYVLYTKNQEAYLQHCAEQGIPAGTCSLWDKLRDDFRHLHYGWISLIFVGFALTNYSRAIRWRILLQTMGYKTSFTSAYSSIFVGYLANLGFPRIGEFVRAGVMARQEQLPADKVFGSILLDRLADITTFFMLVGLAVVVDPGPFRTFFTQFAMLPSIRINGVVLGVVVVALSLFWIFREALFRLSLIRRMTSLISGVWEGMRSIKNLERRNAFVLHTLLIWVWFYLMFAFACKAFEPTASLGLGQMLVIYVFGSFGVFIPSPGGMGTFHYLVIVSLSLYGIQQADAFSFANIAFTWGQFLCLVVFGTASLIWIFRSGRPPGAPAPKP
ncbi:MAG: flippase-like domain-containing protein [Saprospiraceae bacterium]|nr:flippase-like domain-containing protein [Saprospiraceae bacterium]